MKSEATGAGAGREGSGGLLVVFIIYSELDRKLWKVSVKTVHDLGVLVRSPGSCAESGGRAEAGRPARRPDRNVGRR